MLWVVVWLGWPEDAIWVPSCSVMSGLHTGKDAKATSTDSPPKGYGTPNLVVLLLVPDWSLGSLYLGTGLGHGSISRSVWGLGYSDTGHTRQTTG